MRKFCALCNIEAIDLEMNSSIGGQLGLSTFKSHAQVPGARLLHNDRYTGPSITVPQPGQVPGQGRNHLSHMHIHILSFSGQHPPTSVSLALSE